MQRHRLLISSASLLVTMAVTAAIATGLVSDTYEQRLDSLETRVARLEAEVGIATPTSIDTGQLTVTIPAAEPTKVSNQVSGSYSASYSASGNAERTFEVSMGGSYHLTAQSGAPMTVRIESANGDNVLEVETSDDGTITTATDLQPGNYLLHVEADGQWVVIITSVNTD